METLEHKLHVDQHVFFRALGTTHKVLGDSVGGSTAIVEHTLEPLSLGAPMHKHTYEDEISYVLVGELHAIQNGVIQKARPGEFIVKPRGIFHTFWNATNEQIRWLEVITPARFEEYFSTLAPYLPTGKPPDMDKVRETAAKYGLVVDPYAAEEIIKQYGLKPLG